MDLKDFSAGRPAAAHAMFRTRHDRSVQLTITGVHLPGRTFCRPNGSVMDNVHVGVQVRGEPTQLISGDASEAQWVLDLDVVQTDEHVDFRGPIVQGKRGERFVYLTWGNLGASHFEMFRRAKLMLNRVDPEVIGSAILFGGLAAIVDLTDKKGGPRCARIDPPAVRWAADPRRAHP